MPSPLTSAGRAPLGHGIPTALGVEIPEGFVSTNPTRYYSTAVCGFGLSLET